MISLTAKQLRVLQFIAGHIEAKGQSPSYDEIAQAAGLRARSGVNRLVQRLKERGAIEQVPARRRSIAVAYPVPIPRAPDGEPLYFVEVQ